MASAVTESAPHPPVDWLAQFSIASKAAAAVGWQAGYAEAMKAAGFDDPHVRAEPCRRFGAPHVRGRSTCVVAGAVWAGDDVAAVVAEYDLTRGDVLVACWFEAVHGSHGKRRQRWEGWAEIAGPLLAAKDPDYATIPDPPSRDET